MDGPALRTSRPVCVADLAVVARLDKQAYGADSYGEMTLRQFCDIAGDLFQVGTVSGVTVGYALALPTRVPGQACFMSLVVDPKSRGLGLGRELVEAVLANCEEAGYPSIWMTVDAANEASIKLFASFQFSVTERMSEYFGPQRDRLKMVRSADA